MFIPTGRVAGALIVAAGACPLASVPVAALQRIVVEGEVLDARSRLPVYGALVLLSTAEAAASTDDHGYFRMEGVPLGKARIQVVHIGYEEIWGVATDIREGRTLQVFLTPRAVEIEGVDATIRSADRERARASGEPVDVLGPGALAAMRGRVGSVLDVLRAKGPPRLQIAEVGSDPGGGIRYCIQSTRRSPSLSDFDGDVGGCRPALISIDGVIVADPVTRKLRAAMGGRGYVLDDVAYRAIAALTPAEVVRVRFMQPTQAYFRYGERGKFGALLIETR